MTNTEEYSTAIGKILTNLQSLEFTLRLFLYESVGPQDAALNLHQVTKGDWVPENPLTNYDSLGKLIHQVNEQLQKLNISEHVDESLVDLRDALAHGRISSLQICGTYKLLKFSTPKHGNVQVTTAIDLTPQWLTDQILRTHAEILKVIRIGRGIGQQCFPE